MASEVPAAVYVLSGANEPVNKSRSATGQITEILLRKRREHAPESIESQWRLVGLKPRERLPEDFDIRQYLSHVGFSTQEIPDVATREHPTRYGLVIHASNVSRLVEKCHTFGDVLEHDPFAPSTRDVQAHGEDEAKRIALRQTINEAVQAICEGGHEASGSVYRTVIADKNFELALELAILKWDIEVISWPQPFHSAQLTKILKDPKSEVVEKFTRRLLLICVECCEKYTASDESDRLEWDSGNWLHILEWDGGDWLRPFDAAIENSIVKKSEPVDPHVVYLFRRILEQVGGKQNRRQHRYKANYTIDKNASLCLEFLGLRCSRRLGDSDQDTISDALQKSKLYRDVPESRLPDVQKGRDSLLAETPLGIPKDSMTLPPELSRALGINDIDNLSFYLKITYNAFWSLVCEEQDLPLILIVGYRIGGEVAKVLMNWIMSPEGQQFHRDLFTRLLNGQTSEEFVVTLAALHRLEQILEQSSSFDQTNDRTIHSLDDLDEALTTSSLRFGGKFYMDMMASVYRQGESIQQHLGLQKMIAEIMAEEDEIPKSKTSDPESITRERYCRWKTRAHPHHLAFAQAKQSRRDMDMTGKGARRRKRKVPSREP